MTWCLSVCGLSLLAMSAKTPRAFRGLTFSLASFVSGGFCA